ncbi:hypothetical protein LTR74_016335, partial [Friedmanniomyces endolithicus]
HEHESHELYRHVQHQLHDVKHAIVKPARVELIDTKPIHAKPFDFDRISNTSRNQLERSILGYHIKLHFVQHTHGHVISND